MRILALLFFCLGLYSLTAQIITGIKNPFLWSVQPEKSLFGTISPSAEEYFLFLQKIRADIPSEQHYALVLPEQLQGKYQSYLYESIYYLPGRFIHPSYYFQSSQNVQLSDVDFIISYKCHPEILHTSIVLQTSDGALYRVVK
ncbi:MAG TPA: hypothetical protein PK014_11480 [Thermoanaerobaculia bacterium]|nr:hypothetical protein [Thermoanaerobaculia bacterium]HUM30722.1 hypothetical protein [Thermoanaerobaculia bacterium]HXK68989.1 hypothetical protein [Thermoanaerobaculia bacterium]